MIFSKNHEPSDLDKEIAAVHHHLTDDSPESDSYAKAIDQLSKLYKMKESLKDPSSHVSKDALVAAAASIGSILIIVLYEGVGHGIITSKALGFVQKSKI